MKAYHFTADTLRGGIPFPPIGEWLEHSGLHAWVHPMDALGYAPGPLLHLVEIGGTVIKGSDTLVVASRRKILATIDATDVLREFARSCALDVMHLWAPTQVVRDYLETGYGELRAAAWVAASHAAWDAAWDAARAAASAAASAAAWDAAWDAARAAARAAASAAAWDAAWDAARAAQRRRFKKMVDEVLKKSAAA